MVSMQTKMTGSFFKHTAKTLKDHTTAFTKSIFFEFLIINLLYLPAFFITIVSSFSYSRPQRDLRQCLLKINCCLGLYSLPSTSYPVHEVFSRVWRGASSAESRPVFGQRPKAEDTKNLTETRNRAWTASGTQAKYLFVPSFLPASQKMMPDSSLF